MNDNMFNEPNYGIEQAREPLSAYTAKTFGWMALGLLVTFLVAFGGYASGLTIYALISVPMLPFILLIAEVVVVIALGRKLGTLSTGAALGLFFLYAALNGVTFSSLFLLYDLSSMVLVFGFTAVYFAVLAGYGYLTKRDLSRLAPMLFAGLIFLALFWVLSMFLPLSSFDRIACIIGLVIFMGYTAYDTQKIKTMYYATEGNETLAQNAAIYCALQLYLDFINLFLYILRLIGRSNKN